MTAMADDATPAPPAGLSTEDLQALVRRELDSAVQFVDGDLSPARARLADYYAGQLPDLPAPEGRSKAVATVVRDTILAMKPGLLRAFCGPERVVEFRPREGNDTAAAEQRTEYINYVLMEDNPGFLVLEAAIEDALVGDFGVVKWYWEQSQIPEGVVYEHLTLPQLEELLAADPGIVIEALTPNTLGGIRATLTRVRTSGLARVEAVPPEEFVFARDTRALATCRFCAHRRLVPLNTLLGLGYDRAVLEDAVSAGSDLLDNEETQVRAEWDPRYFGSTLDNDEPGDPLLRKVSYVEAYLYADRDGDGLAELRMVCTVGDAGVIVRDEPVADRPFALFQADPKPHTVQGRGIARRVDDLQAIQSVVLRGTLDSLNLALVQGTEVVEGMVNLKDLLNPELGKIVRVKQPGMMREIGHRFMGGDTLPLLDYLALQREDRTGTSRASAGLNPDALQSSTKAAVAATVTASQQQVELVARNLAETGLKPLFRGLYQLVKRYQSEPRIVRLMGSYVPVDPASWDEADPDVSVSVALGLGLAEDRIAALSAISADQMLVYQALGPGNPVVSVKQLRDTLARKAVLAGWKNVEQFYGDVPPDWAPPPAPPPPDPALVLAQIEQQKVQGQFQLDQARLALDTQKAQQEAALAADKLRLEDQRERDRMIVDVERDRMKQEAAADAAAARAERVAVTPEAG